MRTKIWPVLSGALLLSGCGAKDEVGTDLAVCQFSSVGQLADLALPEALDGIEVRSTSGAPVVEFGDSCSNTTCISRVAELDARGEGWQNSGGQFGPTTEYVIGMKGGSVVLVATSDAELVQLIGPVDTLAEAELAAHLHGLGCVRAGEKGGKFEIVSDEYLEICPIEKQEVLYQVNADASVQEIDRGDKVKEEACVGRRPAGLLEARRAPRGAGVGGYLARAAELEAASVIAFQLLERELCAHDAPPALLARTRQAALDEVRHARIVQRLARRFGGTMNPRAIRFSEIRALEAIALENAVEGCVGETWGCLVGMHQARYAADARVRRAYRHIAVDEARHAQLSWDIAAWAEQKLDLAARQRISNRRARAVRELESALQRDAESESVRRVLGLPDAALSRRWFGHVDRQLWS